MSEVGWRAAMQAGLYGAGGFFVRGGAGPADHFRTSVHASPLFAGAVGRLVHRVDAALGHPPVFDVVDVGAGRGELLTAMLGVVGGRVADRIRMVGVERAARPAELDPRIGWRSDLPDRVNGVLLATEWLDNVPLDIAEADEDGLLRRVLVDPGTGTERLGPPTDAADRMWAARWWTGSVEKRPKMSYPGANLPPTQCRGGGGGGGREGECRNSGGYPPGERVEIGWTRDAAWAEAVGRVAAGVALAVDYGHLKGDRPRAGTLTGFRDGRQVTPVPDGTCDVTAHVAMDAVATAGGGPYTLRTQREALRALGVDGARPPLDLARTDPAGYLRALGAAGAAAELTDPDGLGGHWWLLHSVGLGGRGTMLE